MSTMFIKSCRDLGRKRVSPCQRRQCQLMMAKWSFTNGSFFEIECSIRIVGQVTIPRPMKIDDQVSEVSSGSIKGARPSSLSTSKSRTQSFQSFSEILTSKLSL